jgi:uncharacterized protein (TIGR03437 family)
MKLLTLALLLAPCGWAASSSTHATFLGSLPAGATPTGSAVDKDGNILISGNLSASSPVHAFLAKLSPDAQTLIFFQKVGGNGTDNAGPVAVDSSGNIYVSGVTSSPDFPTTSGAWQTSLSGASGAGFVTKFDSMGKVVYSTLFYAFQGQSTGVSGIAVNAAGEAFLTGITVGHFPASTSPLQPNNPANTFYVLRLSSAGDNPIYSVGVPGGTAIAVDAQSNAYITGFADYYSDLPVTPGAYQTTVPYTVCGSTRAFVMLCEHQYVAKLDPTGNKLLFWTFVSGSYQDLPAAIAVDSQGNVYLGGTTGSADYPTTTGALGTTNRAAAPPYLNNPDLLPLANTGYVTKLSSDGTHLIYSTLLGGTNTDAVTGLALDANGQLYVSARAQSPDFPSLPQAPARCLPDLQHDIPVLLTLDPNGAAITSESTIDGVPNSAVQLGLALAPQGGAVLVAGGPYAAVVPTLGDGAQDAIGCIADSLDYSQGGIVAPGQLLTIFGTGIGPATAASYDPSATSLPAVLGGVSVLVNGQPAPMLFASSGQINFVIPYEAASLASITIEVAGAKRTLPTASAVPSLAIGEMTGYSVCDGGTPYKSAAANVLNEDGSTNTCANPAKAGSTVKFFLNGTGINSPGSTGQNPANPIPLLPAVTERAGYQVVRAISAPGSPLGVWEVDVKIPPSAQQYILISLSVGGTPANEQNVPVWVTQ